MPNSLGIKTLGEVIDPTKVGWYLGIDPGLNGGLAVITPSSEVIYTKMPETERDAWEWVSGFPVITFAVIEKVGGYISSKPRANNGSAMFKFGMNYGGMRMALVAAGIPFSEAAPRTWQSTLKIQPRSKSETSHEWKTRLKAKAQQTFPAIKVTLSVADALLLAYYCRLVHGRG